nr:MAG: ORF1 [TTV-like mini virus]UGV34446.1 MAG: ORF1 [TTV-like mini virus]UGV34500.1 MAG: ORF1 [TTV-like mini virus]UGV34534.1 MAG: ORF1 [TTV-like mini virus]UGV34885.1 MAG: ORF1 [TTV-like mini virus]
MPWNYWYRPYWGRRRRRRYWRRRARSTFFRKPRRRRVRIHRKLKKITVKEWQPKVIRRCNIRGLICLCAVNKNRLGNNYIMYESSITPEFQPGNGGFSVMKYSLETLYDMHEQCRNWWSNTNDNLPLCRYTGCKIKIYQAEKVDIIFRYDNTLPMTSNQLTYPSLQPSISMMLPNSIIIPSKRSLKRKKPYVTLRIDPPPQFQTKWYFQKDMYKIPLLTTFTTAASLDNYYISSQAESNSISLESLNTTLFQNRNWANVPSTGYAAQINGTINTYLYATDAEGTPQIGQMIALANTKTHTAGRSFLDPHQPEKNWSTFKANSTNSWGNPFHEDYLNRDRSHMRLFKSTKDPKTAFSLFSTGTETITQQGGIFTELQEGFTFGFRYNPYKDTGKSNTGNLNKVYLLSNNKQEHGWAEPNTPDLILEGFPLWIALFGFLDFQKRLQKITGIDNQYMLVIDTKALSPQYHNPIVLIDGYFKSGNSPYLKGIHHTDMQRWYLQTQYQTETINNIILSGPGSAKLEGYNSAEIKAKYNFYFKFGGNPGKIHKVENPADQPIYPIPRNQQQTTSLQPPDQPIEYYLSQYDERRGLLTSTAAKRIKQDKDIEKTLLSFAGHSSKEVPIETQQTSDSETSDSEKEEETLILQLQQQLKRQRLLKRRILKLVTPQTNL